MSALIQISNFGNNAAAVEKSLRLAQSFTLIAGGLQETAVGAAPYVLARSQFNLSRRFLRLHKWIDCFNAAAAAMSSSKTGVPKVLETAKFSFLGIYFLMEMCTITDIMGLTKFDIGPWLVVESNRMWFYGLVLGILQAIWEGLSVTTEASSQSQPSSKEGKKGKKRATEITVTDQSRSRKGLPYKQLVIDGCDLVIPGAVIQVIPFSPLVVGIAMATSTVLQISDMWPKVQAQSMAMPTANKRQ